MSTEYDDQLRLLQDLWFTPYSRGRGIVGSSSFEHVFMAELRDQKVLGLHNWLYFADQEQRGNVDYKGWLSHQNMGKVGGPARFWNCQLKICHTFQPNQMLLGLRHTFHNIRKPVNGFFVGTSPELELSLYTACFLTTAEEEPCHIQLGRVSATIVSHGWNWNGMRLIATAYPENS